MAHSQQRAWAANYVVGPLEEMGCLERRATGRSQRRLIYLTPRGRKVVTVVHHSLRPLHAQGSPRWGSSNSRPSWTS
jgi:DNA-binding MarR family transcriptional regulator